MEPYNLGVLEGTQLENQWLNDMRHVFEIYESHLPPFVIPNPSLRSPRLPLELLKLIVENLDGTIEEERETLWCLCLTNQDLSFYSRPILYRDIEFDLEEDSWRLKLLLQVLEKRKYLRTMVLDLTFCRDTTASVYTPNLTDHTELNPGPTSTTVTTTTTGSQPNTYEFQWKTLQGVKVFHQLFLRGPTLLPNLQKLCLSDIPQLHPSITSLRRFPFFKVRELVIWDTQFTSLLDLRRLMENIFPDILHLSLNHVDFQFSHVSFYPPTPNPNFNLNQDQDHGFRDDTGQDGDTTTTTTTTSAAAQPRRLGRVQVNLEELESWQLSPRALSIIKKWISTRVNTFKSIKSLHIPNEALSWLRICGRYIRDLTIYWPTRKDPNSNPQMNMMVNLDTDDSRMGVVNPISFGAHILPNLENLDLWLLNELNDYAVSSFCDILSSSSSPSPPTSSSQPTSATCIGLYAYPNTIQDSKTFELLDHTLSQVSLVPNLERVEIHPVFWERLPSLNERGLLCDFDEEWWC